MNLGLQLILLLLVLVVLVSVWGLFYQLLRQQGRLLLRLETLEERFASGAPLVQPGLPINGSPVEPPGLPIGAEVPPFRLRDLDGNIRELRDFADKRVLLVHWSPSCGFCTQIAPDLAKLQNDLRKRKTELVLVSYGDSESNRRLAKEHGLDCPILLQEQSDPLEAFTHLGTPVAYLLDERGRVAERLAIGANEVPALAQEVARGKRRLRSQRPLGESRIEREGLKPGTPAPAFELPALDGQTVSLEEYRGRRVLLVFSDPHCGPCDAVAPHLARIHREEGDTGLALLMISRGERDENRRKRNEHGIDFPMVIQPGWNVSKQYGIFATPVAFLINEEGLIEREVAQGADEILALAQDGLVADGRRP